MEELIRGVQDSALSSRTIDDDNDDDSNKITVKAY